MKPFEIPSPCHEDWNQMRNDGAARHCFSCEKSVYDLAKLTERQIAGLVLVSGGHFCGRQTLKGGEMVVAPPPTPKRSASLWPIRSMGAAVMASALSAAACAPASAKPPEPVVTAPADPQPKPQPTPAPPVQIPPEVFERQHVMAGMIAYTPPTMMATELTFARGKANVDKTMKQAIADAAAFLLAEPAGTVTIQGHASLEETKQPKRLAVQRADAVKKALIAHGVPRERLTTLGVEATVSGDEAYLARTVTVRLQVAR